MTTKFRCIQSPKAVEGERRRSRNTWARHKDKYNALRRFKYDMKKSGHQFNTEELYDFIHGTNRGIKELRIEYTKPKPKRKYSETSRAIDAIAEYGLPRGPGGPVNEVALIVHNMTTHPTRETAILKVIPRGDGEYILNSFHIETRKEYFRRKAAQHRSKK